MSAPPLARRRTAKPHVEDYRGMRRNLRDMLPYLWDYRGRVLLALTFLLVAKVANVGVPVVLKYMVDALDAGKQVAPLLPVGLLVAYGVLRLMSSLFNELRDAIFARVRYHAMRQVSTQFLAHLHRLSLRYHLERQTGAVSRDLDRGVQSISTILNYLVFNGVPLIVEFLLVAAILSFSYEWKFAVVTALTVLIYVAFTLAVTEWRIHHRFAMNDFESRANMQAIDSLMNYETVKSFGNEALEERRYNETLKQWEDAAVQSQTSMSLLNFGQSAIIALGVTLLMVFASQGVLAGTMSLGDLVLVNAFLLQLFLPLNFLGVIYRAIKYALVDMDNMFQLLAKQPEVEDAAGARPLLVRGGEVRFEQVDFYYQADRPILRQVDFVIPAGHKVAIVGASGSGKSTIARLLFRFYDVMGGSIKIDGQDVRFVTQASLRAAISIVPQDTILFNDTIFYNIVYGKPDASKADVEKAAVLANIHHFIESLPQGYETVVGERGLKLSGGEKQRVAIARAVLKQPRLMIFDEATSALDSHSEKLIQAALQQVAQHHTTLVIAHRLSTIVDAHQILVMEHGQIVERGTHQALLSQKGRYAQMWMLQQQEELLAGIRVVVDGS